VTDPYALTACRTRSLRMSIMKRILAFIGNSVTRRYMKIAAD
jgi:hypothetical protein